MSDSDEDCDEDSTECDIACDEVQLAELHFSNYLQRLSMARTILRCCTETSVIATIAQTLNALPPIGAWDRTRSSLSRCDVLLIIAAQQTSFDCRRLIYEEIEPAPPVKQSAIPDPRRKQLLCVELLADLADIVCAYQTQTVVLRVGMYLNVLDDVTRWCISEIIGLVKIGDLAFAKIRYLNWSSKYDEWVPCTSPRIRILLDPHGQLVSKCEFLPDSIPPDKLMQWHDSFSGNWFTVLNSNFLGSRSRLQKVAAGTFMESSTTPERV